MHGNQEIGQPKNVMRKPFSSRHNQGLVFALTIHFIVKVRYFI